MSYVDQAFVAYRYPTIDSLQYPMDEGTRAEHQAFLRAVQECDTLIDDIVANPTTASVYTRPSSSQLVARLYTIAYGLAERHTKSNEQSIFTYLTRLMDAGYAEFAALCARLIKQQENESR